MGTGDLKLVWVEWGGDNDNDDMFVVLVVVVVVVVVVVGLVKAGCQFRARASHDSG
jgi:heme/copper-type cytochrome/quinol oxidase subunit 2